MSVVKKNDFSIDFHHEVQMEMQRKIRFATKEVENTKGNTPCIHGSKKYDLKYDLESPSKKIRSEITIVKKYDLMSPL